MRLTPQETQKIKDNIIKYIDDAIIILFGSRTDDNKKGGDIDLFVQTKQNIPLSKKINILTDIELSGISRKIDLVLKTPSVKEQPIHKTAIKEGILL